MRKIKYEALYKKCEINKGITPTICYLKITNKCNLNCYFCSQKDNNRYTDMTIKVYKKLLHELKSNNVNEIIFTGGEPLCNTNCLKMIKMAYDMNFQLSLITNLTYDNLESIKDIFKYVNSVGVSLYGIGKVHDNIVSKIGTFKKISLNLEKIKEYNNRLNINVNCTLVKENMQYSILNELMSFCDDKEYSLNFARINFIGGSANSYTKDYIADMNKVLEELVNMNIKINISNCIAPCILNEKIKFLSHGCGAGLSFFSIESNGDVTICASSKEVIGNISESKLRTIFKSNKIKEYKSLKWLPTYCIVCKHSLYCRGGCHAEKNETLGKYINDKTVINNNELILNDFLEKKPLMVNNKCYKYFNKYILEVTQIRIVNFTAIEVLSKFNGENTVKKILDDYNNSNEIREFMIAIIKDGIIK
ncbi:MAG: radical SAM protein [Cetobacterium sp.]